jgi:5-methylcytosine-specific restriction endonuclease McrA
MIIGKQICSICKKDLTFDYFYKNKSNKKTGIGTQCKECSKNYKKEHYINNKDIYIKGMLKFKAWFIELKTNSKCNRCGYNKHPAALDFHHIIPSEKNFAITIRGFKGKNKDEILKEIAKCEVLCSNCHRIEHVKHY